MDTPIQRRLVRPLIMLAAGALAAGALISAPALAMPSAPGKPPVPVPDFGRVVPPEMPARARSIVDACPPEG